VHTLPAAFTIAAVLIVPLIPWSIAVLIDASARNRSLHIGLLAVAASFVQLTGYGTGFLRAWWLRCVLGRDEELQAFKKSFYK
ncbi:MAG: glycosyl transferase family 2, partial [Bacteroidales bacterium]|nr:glycosyl transferase family 2 [Bacteroidales bacterium]